MKHCLSDYNFGTSEVLVTAHAMLSFQRMAAYESGKRALSGKDQKREIVV